MRPLSTLFPTTLAAALMGCATPPQPPLALSQEPDAAKVRFVNKVKLAWIDLYPETECNRGINVIHQDPFVRAMRSMSGGPRREAMLDPPAADDGNVAEYAFKPGQVINVGSGDLVGRSCLGGLSFVAAPATQYEVVLSMATPERCSLTVSVLAPEDGTIIRRPLRGVRPLVCKGAYR